MLQMGTETLPDSTKGEVMGKLERKVAVITGGSSGMALASAKRFVEEGAYVFIMGRRQEALDEASREDDHHAWIHSGQPTSTPIGEAS
jgi:NAD(P)-dependent dehydrogenase (short-subunit alcohol dehydrogenase family)